jgi:hypothetical protein
MTLTRDVDGKKVAYGATGNLQLTGGVDAFADEQVRALGAGSPFAATLSERGVALADALGMTFEVELPAGADATNGTREGDAARWEVPLDGSAARVEATATSNPSNTAKRLLALLALGVFLAWIALAVAFFTYVARHRRPPAARRR